MRTKQDYVLNDKDGKKIPEKVGLKSVQRDGVDYEFTLVFDVDIKHFATTSKDRTGLFEGRPDFIISEKTGREILDWCNAGFPEEAKTINPNKASSLKSNLPKIEPLQAFECPEKESFKPSQNLKATTEEEVYQAISNCSNIQELYGLYKAFPQFQQSLKVDFEAKKSLLINLTNPNNFSKNGHTKFN